MLHLILIVTLDSCNIIIIYNNNNINCYSFSFIVNKNLCDFSNIFFASMNHFLFKTFYTQRYAASHADNAVCPITLTVLTGHGGTR